MQKSIYNKVILKLIIFSYRNHWMIWAGTDLEDHLAPNPSHGQCCHSLLSGCPKLQQLESFFPSKTFITWSTMTFRANSCCILFLIYELGWFWLTTPCSTFHVASSILYKIWNEWLLPLGTGRKQFGWNWNKILIFVWVTFFGSWEANKLDEYCIYKQTKKFCHSLSASQYS